MTSCCNLKRSLLLELVTCYLQELGLFGKGYLKEVYAQYKLDYEYFERAIYWAGRKTFFEMKGPLGV